MKKILTSLLAAIFVLVMALPAMSAIQDMQATVYRWSGNFNMDGSPGLTKATTGITYKVLAKGSNTAETLYAYYSRGLTAKTNPVTATVFATDKEIKFRLDPTDSTDDRYVDLIVTDTVGGYSTVVKNFDKYTHTVVLDERPNIPQKGTIWFSGTTTDAISTGIIFDKYTRISNVQAEIVTVLSGGTISVGLYEAATGYINKELMTTAGFITTSGESTGSYLGTGTAYQWYNQGQTLTSGTSTLYYTVSSTTGTPAGYIHYYFSRVR